MVYFKSFRVELFYAGVIMEEAVLQYNCADKVTVSVVSVDDGSNSNGMI